MNDCETVQYSNAAQVGLTAFQAGLDAGATVYLLWVCHDWATPLLVQRSEALPPRKPDSSRMMHNLS